MNCIKALDNNLTPVIWKGGIGEDMAHALVIASIQTSDQNESFYVCKNTLKERREQLHDSLINEKHDGDGNLEYFVSDRHLLNLLMS